MPTSSYGFPMRPPPSPSPPELTGAGAQVLPVANKIDLVPAGAGVTGISAKTGAGVDKLVHKLAAHARERLGTSTFPAITRERYRQHINAGMSSLHAFMSGSNTDIELRAEDLRQAAHALGRITGRVDVEDILGEIFARFCVGK